MLVDDNRDDNFFHERAIKKISADSAVVTKNSALDGLAYLKSNAEGDCHPDLIFLDINMPGMNGWEFLQQYSLLDKKLQSRAIIIMLTTSQNPDDAAKAKTWSAISDYITKPLTKEMIRDIIGKYFESEKVLA